MPRSITLYEIQSVNANNSLKSGSRRRYYEINIIFVRILESEKWMERAVVRRKHSTRVKYCFNERRILPSSEIQIKRRASDAVLPPVLF